MSGEFGLHSGGKALRSIQSPADDGRGCDVVFAEVAHGLKVFRIELDGALEFVMDFDSEAKCREGAGVGCFVSVSTGEPHVIVAVVGCVGDGKFTLVDGGVGLVLRVVDTAEELMGLSVAGVVTEEFLKHGCGLVNASLLEQGIGAGFVGNEEMGRCEESE